MSEFAKQKEGSPAVNILKEDPAALTRPESKKLSLSVGSPVVGNLPKRDTPYVVHPAPGVVAPNNSSPYPVLMENGMNMAPESILAMGQAVSNRFGRPTLVIPNHTEGFAADLRNCILSALSNQRGINAEPGAAQNMARAIVSRINDSYPVEINCYSQGTLITQDVLSELRRTLIERGQTDTWDRFAERVELRSYGAAIHRWPPGIKAQEYRHVGDYVSVVGDAVSSYQGVTDIVQGDFGARRANVVVLPTMKDAHSIQVYLSNSTRFYLESIEKLPIKDQSRQIINSMNTSEFSNAEYCSLFIQLHEMVTDPRCQIKDHNRAVLLAREISTALPNNPAALDQLSEKAVDALVETAARDLREATRPNFGKGLNLRAGIPVKIR